jgi:protease-4
MLKNEQGIDRILASSTGRRTLAAILVCSMLAVETGCTFLKVSIVDEVQPLREKTIDGHGRDKILVLDLTGIIMGGETGSLLTDRKKPGLLPRVREALDRARRDKNLRAVVLRISSPGGGVTASDTLYHELKRFKQETGLIMVAHIMDVGASGAYYAALAADAITAQPTSVTGSIGVIMYRVDATALLQKIGIQTTEITAGERKGLGSPFRPLSEDERRLYQGFIDNLYERFTGLVVQERKLTPERVRNVADGRIFTSREAQEAGLLDGIGYLDDAVELAKKKAHIEQATVVMYHRPGEYRANLYSLGMINLDLGDLAEPGGNFFYLWWP